MYVPDAALSWAAGLFPHCFPSFVSPTLLTVVCLRSCTRQLLYLHTYTEPVGKGGQMKGWLLRWTNSVTDIWVLLQKTGQGIVPLCRYVLLGGIDVHSLAFGNSSQPGVLLTTPLSRFISFIEGCYFFRGRLFDPLQELMWSFLPCLHSCEHSHRVNFEECPSSGKRTGTEE